MPKVIPVGADTDESYELNENASGNGDVAYYSRKRATNSLVVDKSDVTKVTVTQNTGRSA
jgi:hypothetical protein